MYTYEMYDFQKLNIQYWTVVNPVADKYKLYIIRNLTHFININIFCN